MSNFGGTPFDELFETLTLRMGVLHTVEPAPTQRARVVWEHAGFSREAIGYTIPGTVTLGRHAHKYRVSIYGDSDLEVGNRAAQMEGHLDALLGPPQGAPPPAGDGYKVSDATPIQGGDGAAAGYGCTLIVMLYRPIFGELRPSLTVGEIDLTTTAAAGQGASSDGVLEAALVAV